MAAVAIHSQLFSFSISRMTVTADRFDVGAPEYEFGVLVVIENDLLPTDLRVTFGTFVSQCALMGIVKFVAGIAGFLELAVEHLADMTGFTAQIGMQTFQRKFRVFVVVEAQVYPSDGAVALIALPSVAA